MSSCAEDLVFAFGLFSHALLVLLPSLALPGFVLAERASRRLLALEVADVEVLVEVRAHFALTRHCFIQLHTVGTGFPKLLAAVLAVPQVTPMFQEQQDQCGLTRRDRIVERGASVPPKFGSASASSRASTIARSRLLTAR